MSAAIPAAAIPTRPRDFTLTPADAARLRPRGLRRWLAGIGTARDGVSFPLALGLTTMGIAGLLFATVPGVLSGMGGATAGAAPETLSAVGAAIPAPAAASAAPVASHVAAAAPSAAPSAAAPVAAEAAPSAGTAQGDTFGPIDPDSLGGGGVFSGDDGERASADGQRQDANDMTADASIRDDSSGFSTLMIVACDPADRRPRTLRPPLERTPPRRRMTVAACGPGAALGAPLLRSRTSSALVQLLTPALPLDRIRRPLRYVARPLTAALACTAPVGR